MAASLEIFGSIIVVVGNFNPPIFSPDWLERNNLIGSADAAGAREHKDLVVAKIGSRVETEWFILQVLEQQLSLTSKGVLTPAIKDLAVGIFTLVSQTPVSAVGLNCTAHYKLANEDEYHKIGDTLVPKGLWNKVFPGGNQWIGVANLNIKVIPSKRGVTPIPKNNKSVMIQPSGQVDNGIFFAFNDHHEIEAPKESKSTAAELVARVIGEFWEPSLDEAKRVFNGIIGDALKS